MPLPAVDCCIWLHKQIVTLFHSTSLLRPKQDFTKFTLNDTMIWLMLIHFSWILMGNNWTSVQWNKNYSYLIVAYVDNGETKLITIRNCNEYNPAWSDMKKYISVQVDNADFVISTVKIFFPSLKLMFPKPKDSNATLSLAPPNLIHVLHPILTCPYMPMTLEGNGTI